MSRAIAKLEGEIANDMKLTPGGMLQVNILVHYEGNNGQQIPNYIPTKWFKPDSEDIIGRFRKGQEVEIVANVKMNKRKDEQYYQVNLIGTSIKAAGKNAADKIKEAFDASDVTETFEDGIPF